MVKSSIIIPTYKRSHTLLRALQSLQDQTVCDFEILVVDNGVDRELENAVVSFSATARVPVHYVPEPRLGLHHARHAGVRAARGEFLLLTDDDATFCPEWVQAYAGAFDAHPAMVAAGGPVRPVWETPPPRWLLSYMGDAKVFGILSLMELDPTFRLDRNGFFFGVNMAVRRSVFEWTGFHPELIGTRTIGNGETGLNQDIITQGGLIGYVPDALVFHHVTPHRQTIDYVRKWAWHLGASDMYSRWWNRRRALKSLAKEAVIVGRQYWRAWVADYAVRHRTDPRAIETQFQASLGWSKLRYVWWMFTDADVQAALDIKDFRP